jgi:hypothetical protein
MVYRQVLAGAIYILYPSGCLFSVFTCLYDFRCVCRHMSIRSSQLVSVVQSISSVFVIISSTSDQWHTKEING